MLFLVRHGQTDANARGLLQGHVDLPLSARGRDQAAALAALVPDGARVVSSPLRRARETAAAFGRPVDVDARWIELDYGELDGVPVTDVPPDTWRSWRQDPRFTPPGGESLAALGVRVRDACGALVPEIRDHDVVVVSHVSPIKAALAWALGVGDEVAWRMYVQVGSLARVTVNEWGPSLHSFNEVPAVAPASTAPR